MTNFRKIFSVMLALMMIFCLCSCNLNQGDELYEEEEVIIEYSQVGSTDDVTNQNSQVANGSQEQNVGTATSSQSGQTTQTNNNDNNKKVKTIKVLAIGNSYSNNATQYISRIADSTNGDTTIMAASLYFAGATLSQHITNIEQWESIFAEHSLEETKQIYYSDQVSKGKKYEWLQVGDKSIRTIRSLYEAIRYEDWDYITIQQSPDGCDNFETYWTETRPLLTKLYDYIQAEYKRDDMKGKTCPPILIHQTWAFNDDMAKNNAYENYPVNYKNNTEMFKKVEEAYNLAAQKLKETKNVTVPIIKSGEAVELAQQKYGYSRVANEDLTKNTLYADYISHLNARGCYLTACVWIETLAKLSGTTIDTTTATFVPAVSGASIEDCQTLQYIAKTVVHGEK